MKNIHDPSLEVTMKKLTWCVLMSFFIAVPQVIAQSVWLDDLDLTAMELGWGNPHSRKSVEGNTLTVAGQKFERGIGTHAVSTFMLSLDGKGKRFTASVGIDDETGNKASISFYVLGDKKVLWESGVMRKGDAPRRIDLTIQDIKLLGLLVTDAGDGIDYDHGDWCDAKLELSGNRTLSEMIVKADLVNTEPYIVTPIAPDQPRINCARVFGVRPGNPFLYTIGATGKRPMTFSAKDLPDGVTLDSSGRITGSVAQKGVYKVTLVAHNEFGRAERGLRVSVGDRICLTPPMGWNSWNCWAGAVDDGKVRTAAKAMVETGLINHGWTYINIDDTWQGLRGGEYNAIRSNAKFSDMKNLSEYVHGLGLKLGIYSTPWITSYALHCGGSSDNKDGTWKKEEMGNDKFWKHGTCSFDENDAKQWAQWGIDYLKYDMNPNNVEAVERMRNAFAGCGRDIVYSLSNSAPYHLASEWKRSANCWRTTGDITDTWASMSGIGFSQDRWREFAGPSHWNDPDMLVVGLVGWGPDLHPSRLKPDELYTHISLWSLLSAPLLLGCDLSRLDDFTLNLLTNDEVIEVNQDPLGKQARRLSRNDGKEIWVKNLEDGSFAVGLFYVASGNITPVDYFNWEGRNKTTISLKGSDLGISGKYKVRDLWRQKDLGVFDDQFEAEVPIHGVMLVRLTAEN